MIDNITNGSFSLKLNDHSIEKTIKACKFLPSNQLILIGNILSGNQAFDQITTYAIFQKIQNENFMHFQ